MESVDVIRTELGFVAVAAEGDALVRSSLFEPTAEQALRAIGVGAASAEPTATVSVALSTIARYAVADPNARIEDIPVAFTWGSATQHAIWAELRAIPRGETRTYSWIAERVGLAPGAARAVGATVGANPIPLFLPCHRVIGRDGSLRGFAGGLDMKRRLLALEGALPELPLEPV